MVATATALTLAGIAAASGSSVAAAKMQSNAAKNAAKSQTTSANYAADLQAKGADSALTYTKEQDTIAQQRAEADRRANYDQWAARERSLSDYGQQYGYAARNIPGYVPSMQTGTLGQIASTQPSAGPTGDLSSAQAAFDNLFPGETLTPDMLKQNEAQLKALGFTLRPNAAGVVGKVQYQGGPIIDVIQGASSGVNKKWFDVGKPAGAAGTLGQMAGGMPYQTQIQAPRTAPLTAAQQGMYRAPSTLRDYMGRGA